MNKLVIISLDDWEALYVNGKCEDQGHSISISDVAEFTPISSISRAYCDDDSAVNEHAQESGYLPDNLNDVIKLQPDLAALFEDDEP